jgi:hypothetical protein
MQNSSRLSQSTLAAGIAALILVGCSANGSQFNPAATPATTLQQATRMQPDQEIGGSPVYTAAGNCIVEYVYNVHTHQYDEYVLPKGCHNADGGPFLGIAYQPIAHQWFMGASAASANFIAVENSKGKQVGTLTGLTGSPVGIATDSKGDVWATNFPSNTISEYNPGATEPSASYTDGNLASLRYIAVDQNDRVYVSGQSSGSGSLEVDELQGFAFTPINTITGAVGAGIAVSPTTQTLWVCDEGDGTSGTISAYTMPGFKRRVQFAYSGDDTGIAVNKSGKQLYAINNVADGSQFNVSVVVYDGKTGKVLGSTPSFTASAKAVGISNRK